MLNKLMKAIHNLNQNEQGMTGLETAIILIAFVTVAAVFGYAVLSAGLFSAERGKETIYAGLEQAKSNMELAGSVIALSTDNTTISTVKFTVRNAIAGTPIDVTSNNGSNLNKVVISLTAKNIYYNNVQWSTAALGAADSDNLMEAGEQFEITLDMAALGGTFADPTLGVNDWFNIQLKPVSGSSMTIQRTLPAGIDPVIDLH